MSKVAPTLKEEDIRKKKGDASFALTASTNSTGSVSYTVDDTSIATVSGNTVTIVGSGSTEITATVAGDANYNEATATLTLTVSKVAPTLTVADISKNYGDASFALTASTNSTGSVSYTVDDTSIATVSGNTVTIVGSGSTEITATVAGDANYNEATATLTLTVSKVAPTLTVADISKNYGDASFALTASTNSTGSVSYTVDDTSIATVSGNTVTIVGSGSTEITATVAGDANYNEATATLTLTVSKVAPTLTVADISKNYGDASFALTASTNSTGSVSYTVDDTSIATVSGNTVTIVGSGSTEITATVAGDANYNEATATLTLTVSKVAPTLTVADISKNYGDASFALTASTNSTGSVSYTVDDTSIATVSGNTVTIVGSGSTEITATVAGDANYNEATATLTLTVSKVAPTLTVADISKNYGDASFALTASTNGTGSVSYTVDDTSIATVSGNTVTIVGSGSTEITATVAGDANYNEATATLTLTVSKVAPTLTVADISKNYGDASFALTASTNSTGSVSYTVDDTSIATVSGNTVTIVGSGSTEITATVAGDANYNEATATLTLTVSKVAPTLTVADISKNYGDASFALTASTNSTGSVSYTVDDTSIATVSGNTVTIVGSGSTEITATVAGDANYNEATATLTLTVSKVAPTLTVADISKNYGD